MWPLDRSLWAQVSVSWHMKQGKRAFGFTSTPADLASLIREFSEGCQEMAGVPGVRRMPGGDRYALRSMMSTSQH